MGGKMIRKLFRKMSNAQIISALSGTLCPLIDSIVIGRFLGVNAMSSYGIAGPLIIVIAAVGIMLTCGVQVRIGKALGSGDRDATDECYSSSIALSLFISILAMLMVFAAGDMLCMVLGAGTPSQDNLIAILTRDYLRGYILGIPFFFLSQIMTAYLQAMGKQRLLVISVAAMTVTDVAFDLLSVYVFNGGMFGIGVASGLSFLAAFAVGLVYFMSKECIFGFRMNAVRPSCVLDIARAGSPVLVSQSCYTVRVLFFNLMLLKIGGSVAVAAFAVITTIANLVYSIGVGAGSVTLMLSSIFYSDEDRTSLLSLVREMLSYTAFLIIITVSVVEIFSPAIIGVFLKGDRQCAELAVLGLRMFMIAIIFSVTDNVFKSYFQGINRTYITNIISLLESVVILIPCVLILSRFWGYTGFWTGVILGQILTFSTVFLMIWRKYGRVSVSPEAVSYLDPLFGAGADNCIEMTVTDEKEAILASERFCGFCREKGMEPKLIMKIGLCVEEIAINVIKHGFSGSGGNGDVDMRLVVNDDKTVLRFRDNCLSFDPTDYLKLHRDDDPVSHIGLRMTMGIVREADYVNTLGLNNLTLVL